ncbi:hypothetical protein Syn7502_01783 [Synechococcus sp. PCC 7502]|uniref:hypothetical protein n=1 Tax=Synechococcus sp. PCC 7502 TaxID=1173263 RepID=UPI00029FC5BB|nr:hypothetical protein [Synechococcus sp. PCC 7502]AFY73827.1 hypothetical protein Syn7502_01783 [Synechococcus sp. PCC 7502]
MNEFSLNNESITPITLVISEVIDPNCIDEYEAWTKGINQAAQKFAGFLGVEVISPRNDEYPEYVVIVKFDHYQNFRTWMTSRIYQEWLEKSRGLVATRSLQQLPNGIEMWFSLPKNNGAEYKEPPYYKKVILGVLAVYPLIVLANIVLNPFLQNLNSSLSLLISVTFVSALLTYPVMPKLTELLRFWLYPSLPRRRYTKR